MNQYILNYIKLLELNIWRSERFKLRIVEIKAISEYNELKLPPKSDFLFLSTILFRNHYSVLLNPSKSGNLILHTGIFSILPTPVVRMAIKWNNFN